MLLVSHGSQHDDGASMRQLAKLLSRHFPETRASSLHGRPTPAEALGGMAAARIHVVPILAASGHVGNAMLRERLPASDRRLLVHPPIGRHPGLAEMVIDLVSEVVTANRLDPRQTAVVLLGHGNPRDPAAAAPLVAWAGAVAAAGCVADCRCHFLAAPPAGGDWPQWPAVIVVPCLFSAGHHLRVDLPALIEDARAALAERGRRLWSTPPLGGQADRLAPLILEMVGWTAGAVKAIR